MKILIAGDWHSELHEEVAQRALRELGHEVEDFKWFRYFKPRSGWHGQLLHYAQRIQDKYVTGPALHSINQAFVARVDQVKPQMIFIYRGTHITSASLLAIKKLLPNVAIIGYNNDDPFAPSQPRYLWRHFIAAIPHYDLMLAYRHANVAEYLQAGAKKVEMLRSWYVPWRNRPVQLTETERHTFECDVVFVGHFEPDQRLDHLEEIVRQGYRLRLFGPTKYWASPLASSKWLKYLIPVNPLSGDDYNRALCGAKVVLCFFSKLNRDTYTRRCFEIPATGSLMLSEYSEDLSLLYREGVEADYFRNRDEMMCKIKEYVKNDSRRQAVAQAGWARVQADGHDVISRMRQVMHWTEELLDMKGNQNAAPN